MNGIFWAVVVIMVCAACVLLFKPAASGNGKRSRILIGSVLFVPVVAVVLYMLLGTPQATSVRTHGSGPGSGNANARSMTPSPDGKVGSVGSLLEGLERRLEADPADAGGWLLLAKSYHHLGRDEEAKAAYKKSIALGKEDAEFAALLTNGSASTSAETLSPAAAAFIRGTISIDPDLISQLDPGASVFIYAKAVNGSPMPLAVIRKSVSELPFDFVLDDSLAMVAGMTISSVPEVVVSASVSSTGNAMQPDTGLVASSGPIVVGTSAGNLELHISRDHKNDQGG